MKYLFLGLLLLTSLSILSAQGKVNEALGIEVEFTEPYTYEKRYRYSKIEHIDNEGNIYVLGTNPKTRKAETIIFNPNGVETNLISSKERTTRRQFISNQENKFIIQTYYSFGKKEVFRLSLMDINTNSERIIDTIPMKTSTYATQNSVGSGKNMTTQQVAFPDHKICLSEDHSKLLFTVVSPKGKNAKALAQIVVWDIANNFKKVIDKEFEVDGIKGLEMIRLSGIVTNDGRACVGMLTHKGKKLCIISDAFSPISISHKNEEKQLQFGRFELKLHNNKIYSLGYFRNNSMKVGRVLGTYSAVLSFDGTLEKEYYSDFSPYIFTGDPNTQGPIKHKKPMSVKKIIGYGAEYSLDHIFINTKNQLITVGENGTAQILVLCFDEEGKSIWQKRVNKRQFGMGGYHRYSYTAAFENDKVLLFFNDTNENTVNTNINRKTYGDKGLSNFILAEIDAEGNEQRSILWPMDHKKGYITGPAAGMPKDKNGTYYLLLSELGKKNIKFAKIKF